MEESDDDNLGGVESEENPGPSLRDLHSTSSIGVHSVTSSSVESSVQAPDLNHGSVHNSELRRIIGAFGAGYLLGRTGELDLGIIAQIFV